jgi:ribosomal protein S13
MLRVVTLPADLREKLRNSEVSVSYDTAMRLARVTNPVEQKLLVELAVKGAMGVEIRQRIERLKGARSVRGLRFQTSVAGYTAVVRGPDAPDARRHALAALHALIEKVKEQTN